MKRILQAIFGKQKKETWLDADEELKEFFYQQGIML